MQLSPTASHGLEPGAEKVHPARLPKHGASEGLLAWRMAMPMVWRSEMEKKTMCSSKLATRNLGNFRDDEEERIIVRWE
jgi:hypothetical protein